LGHITVPPALSGSSVSSSLIQVWVIPPTRQQQVLIDSSSGDDDSSFDDDEWSKYSHDPHMMKVSKYLFISLNYSFFVLLIKFLFCVQIIELENRLSQVENELNIMKEEEATTKEGEARKKEEAVKKEEATTTKKEEATKKAAKKLNETTEDMVTRWCRRMVTRVAQGCSSEYVVCSRGTCDTPSVTVADTMLQHYLTM
jgi:hypothetical protein